MRNDGTVRTEVLMATFVTIQLVDRGAARCHAAEREDALERAFDWFRCVEACCTRFDPQSELMQLTGRIGVPVHVSAMLFEAVQFALAVAADSGGAFDPTVGHRMETRGFNREHRTAAAVRTPLAADAVSYRDVDVDRERRTITLRRPLILDLGAVAKGLAIDLAARELDHLQDFAIDAGGDLYLAGHNAAGEPWSVGIRHPRAEDRWFESLRVSNRAVCTSGDYERRSSADGGHHIIDPRTAAAAAGVASVTVVAPTAMLADALATAAFVLGPAAGLRLFDRHGVDGLIVSPGLERYATRGMCSDDQRGREAIAASGAYRAVLPNAKGSAPSDPGDSGSVGRAR